MEAFNYIVVLLFAVAVAYYIGFKDGGRSFAENLVITEQEQNKEYYITVNGQPDLDFDAIATAVEARNRRVPFEQVRAEKIGHEYDRD